MYVARYNQTLVEYKWHPYLYYWGWGQLPDLEPHSVTMASIGYKTSSSPACNHVWLHWLYADPTHQSQSVSPWQPTMKQDGVWAGRVHCAAGNIVCFSITCTLKCLLNIYKYLPKVPGKYSLIVNDNRGERITLTLETWLWVSNSRSF